MAYLWRITARNDMTINSSAGRVFAKGSFVELTTPTDANPLTHHNMLEPIVRAFNLKYSTNCDVRDLESRRSSFTSEKV